MVICLWGSACFVCLNVVSCSNFGRFPALTFLNRFAVSAVLLSLLPVCAQVRSCPGVLNYFSQACFFSLLMFDRAVQPCPPSPTFSSCILSFTGPSVLVMLFTVFLFDSFVSFPTFLFSGFGLVGFWENRFVVVFFLKSQYPC